MTDTTAHASKGLTVVEQYVAFWNAETASEQRRLAAEVFTDDVTYHVPLGVMRGHEQLIGFREQFAQQQPDYNFLARSRPERHHDRARLQWELLTGDESFATGTDVLELDEDGRIAAVTGFLDRAPAGFDAHAH